ncbi:TPA_asm: N [Primula alphacytorhabdovirus 1]|nr:TPA_asm: N [Primula alphacytorhabdovirus 1]
MSETVAQKMARLQALKSSNASPAEQIKPEPLPKIERTINKSYDAVDDVTVGRRATMKWNDLDLSKVTCYDLKQLSAGQMISLGKSLVSQIASGSINSVTIDLCLALAVSIPTPATSKFGHMLIPPAENMGKRIALDQPVTSAAASKGLSAIQKKTLARSKEAQESETNADKLAALEKIISNLEAQESGDSSAEDPSVSDESEASAYGFLAAILIKLCAKTAESFIEGLPRVRDRFAAWYDTKSTVLKTFNPSENALNTLRTGFGRRPEVLSTWILWVACNENRAEKMMVTQQGLLTYLAGQQFSYPGMHAYTLLIEIHEQTGIKFGQLLREMDCPATRSAVKETLEIIRDFEVTKMHPNRTTYFRYARNWDPKYFGTLQSTHCKTLVYVAASVCKKISAQGEKGDPTEIYAIKTLDATLKARLEAVADRMAHKIIDQMLVDAQSGESWTI